MTSNPFLDILRDYERGSSGASLPEVGDPFGDILSEAGEITKRKKAEEQEKILGPSEQTQFIIPADKEAVDEPNPTPPKPPVYEDARPPVVRMLGQAARAGREFLGGLGSGLGRGLPEMAAGATEAVAEQVRSGFGLSGVEEEFNRAVSERAGLPPQVDPRIAQREAAAGLLEGVAKPIRSLADLTPEYQPEVPTLGAIQSAEDVPAFVAGQLGQGISTVLPMVAASAAGGVPAAVIASYGLNSGDVFNELIDNGIPAKEASELTGILSVPVTALDMVGLQSILGGGGATAKKGVAKWLLDRAVGAAGEGVTEMGQEAIQGGATSYVTNQPVLSLENLDRILTAGAGGALVGGALAQGEPSQVQPQPTVQPPVRGPRVSTLAPGFEEMPPTVPEPPQTLPETWQGPSPWQGPSLADLPELRSPEEVRLDMLGAAGRPNVFGEILDSAKKPTPEAPRAVESAVPAPKPAEAAPTVPVPQEATEEAPPAEEKLVQDRKAPKGLIELPTDAIQELGLRRQAEDEARAAAIAGREVRADGPLAPYRAQIDDLRAKLKHSYDKGRVHLRNVRFSDPDAKFAASVGDGVHVRDLDPNHPNVLIRIYQIHNGQIVGFADGVDGQTKMIVGGEPMGSPVSARPLYTKMRELLEPDETLTWAGELARRRELARLEREAANAGRGPEADRADDSATERAGEPGGRVGEGPSPALPASAGPSIVSPEPAATTAPEEAPGDNARVGASVPEVQTEPAGGGRGVEVAPAEQLERRQYTDEERLSLLNYYADELAKGALEQGGMTRDPNERANRYGVDPIQARWGTVSRKSVLPGLENESISRAEIVSMRNRIKRGTATPADMGWIDSVLEEVEGRDAEAAQRVAESFDPTDIEEMPDVEMTPEEKAEADKYSIARPGQRGLPGIGEDVAPTAAKPKGPQQTSMFGGEMLQGVEAKTTEGREAEGPLFTQEAEARAKKEREAQGGLFGDDPVVQKIRAGMDAAYKRGAPTENSAFLTAVADVYGVPSAAAISPKKLQELRDKVGVQRKRGLIQTPDGFKWGKGMPPNLTEQTFPTREAAIKAAIEYEREVGFPLKPLDEEIRSKERAAIGELVEKNRAGLRERISKVFPGVKVEETPDGFVIKLKQGGSLRITPKGVIELSPMAATAGYGKNIVAEVASGKKRVLGVTKSFGPDIVVDIVDKGVLPHESVHVFMDYFATEKEQKLVRAEFERLAEKEGRSWHETAADGYQHWFYDRWFDSESAPSSAVAKFFGNIQKFFKRIYRALFPNHESVFETIRSGEYLERKRSDKSQFRYAAEKKAPVFFSQLAKAAEKIPQAMSGADMLRYLRDPKRGVKADELKWTGLDDYLSKRGSLKVTPKQVQDFVRQNEIRVEEVNLGGSEQAQKIQDQIDRLDADRDYLIGSRDNNRERRDLLARRDRLVKKLSEHPRPAKFGKSDLNLPGGKNYREVLLTLPTAEKLPAPRDVEPDAQARAKHEKDFSSHTKRIEEINSELGALSNVEGLDERLTDLRKRTLRIERGTLESELDGIHQRMVQETIARLQEPTTPTGSPKVPFTAGHFDEPNVLAHVRLNDRVDADGKRVLFVEEIQSDWAQKGRREGFNKNIDAVPSAPFVGSTEKWTELAIKRILRMAAEEGYDRVAWTTGEQQAARYDLSKQIDTVHAFPEKGGTWEVNAVKDGSVVVVQKGLDHKGLADTVGKDLADKIIAKTGTPEKGAGGEEGYVYRGVDLKVGGEGMAGFYDKIVPTVANKLAKKWGAKVGETQIPAGTLNEPSRTLKSVHSLDVTPSMRQSVMEEGQPLFAIKPTEEPPRVPGMVRLYRGGEGAKRGSGKWFTSSRDVAEQMAFDRNPDSPRLSYVDVTPEQAEKFSDRAWRTEEVIGDEQAHLLDHQTAAAATPIRLEYDDGERYAVSGGRLTIPDEVWQDKVLRRGQDKMLRLKRMEEAVGKQGGTVSEQGKTYRAETLFHGRTEERIREVEKDYVDPLIDKMNRLKVTLEELDDYMQVLHEKDRDVLIAKRGGGPKGSGLSPAESARIWRELSAKHGAIQNGTIPKLEQIAKTVRQMREEALRVKVDGGLLTQEEADGWKDTFGPNYIPLKGTDSVGEMPAATGAGYSVKGRESKSATGRSTKAKTPVAYLIRDLESSIIRAEKNRVGQTFYKFVQDNPDLEWEIDKEHKWPENKNGKIVMVPDMAAYQNDFHVKVNGVDHRITIKDELVRKAMKNLDPEQLGVVMKALATANRYFSIMQTTANPGFLVDNFVRDYMAGISNTSAEQGKTIAKKVASSTPEAIRGIWQHARGKATRNPWAGWAKRFARAGGQTGFYDMKSVEDIAKSIENKLKATGSSPAAVARRVSGSVVRLVSDANKAVENGIRLSAFRAMVEAGHTEAEAASVAKSLTVNFNRKGELGPAMNALYAFFNPSVQGSKRLVDVAVNNKTGHKIALGFVGAGFVMDTLARALAGDDDDDGINDYDQIPEFVKERNLIIPGTKVMFKLPYGFNVLFSAGRNMSAVAHGAKGGGKATADTVKTLLSVMNPLGSEASLLQFLSPTMIDPIVQLRENKSFGGQPIYPERRKGDFRPESKMAFKTISPAAKAVAEGASKLTGGDDVRGGWIDVSPEVLEHLSAFVTGGLGRFVGQVATTGTSIAKGETPEPSKTPFVRSLVYSPHASEQSRRFYEYSDELERLASNRKDYIEAGKKEKAKELASGVLRVKGVFDSADRELKRLRTVRDRAEKQKRDTKMIEASIEAQYKRANKAMAEMRKRLGLPAVK